MVAVDLGNGSLSEMEVKAARLQWAAEGVEGEQVVNI